MVNKKHEIPSPDDEVWRLVKIRRNGPVHEQLQGNGIKTVSDFLERYEQDGQKLRIELGIKPKDWDAISKHAKKCVSMDISSQPVDLPQGPVQLLSTDQPAELPQETLE
ncbi:hypothetical protein KP509_31G030200 [Ceratopteris richardii]|uniref:Calmodulin binding protein central domain-containing protein n=1 Tax=Ceratopteris richardii TaxID=49495 RepID=A0A8T2QWP8_CERRI|nr:hypothetical protein KP509_31G030200 [Ceratopteris richardii]